MALPKRHRLRGHRAIDHLHRQGKRHQSPHLLLRVVPAKVGLLPPPDRRAPASFWRCALVISAKVHKRAVVRNRLRRLLHRHLLACLQCPPTSAVDDAATQHLTASWPPGPEDLPAGAMALRGSERPSLEHAPGSLPKGIALSSPVPSTTAAAVSADGPPRRGAGSHAEPKPQPAPAGRPAVAPPDREPPIWLMVSLRPGSAELNADQLLGECTIVLRRAGLIP